MPRLSLDEHALANSYPFADDNAFWLDDDELLENLTMPASIAIARHHGVTNTTHPSFTISETNYKAIDQLLNEFKFNDVLLSKSCKNKDELEVDIEFSEVDRYLLYLFFV